MAIKMNITIDDLAVMVQKGFTGLEDKMDAKFAHVDERFSKLEFDIEDLKTRVNAVEQKLGSVEQKLGSVEQRVSSVEQRLGNVEEILEEHSEELQFIHKKIDEWTDPRSKKRLVTYDEFTKLESRIAELEKKVGVKK